VMKSAKMDMHSSLQNDLLRCRHPNEFTNTKGSAAPFEQSHHTFCENVEPNQPGDNSYTVEIYTL